MFTMSDPTQAPDSATQTDIDLHAIAERFYLQTLDQLSSATLDEPSHLPGWSRKHVAIHVFNNAEALMRLLEWARTGVKTPMYSSAQARDEDIESGVASTPNADVRGLSHEVAAEFSEELKNLPQAALDTPLKTRHGDTITARHVPWMRAREALLHSVDLGIGMTARDFPSVAVDRIIRNVIAQWEKTATPAHFTLHITDRPDWDTLDVATGDATRFSAQPIEVHGEAAEVASYLTGRGWPASAAEDSTKGGEADQTPQDLPTPPPWL